MAQLARAFSQKAVKPQARPATGGTSAPRSAGKGPTTGITGNKTSGLYPYWGEDKPWGEKAQGYGGAPYSSPPAAPAPSSAGAASSSSTPRPWDAAYETSVNSANARYNNTLLGLQGKKGILQQEYGLEPGFNDYNANPYSRASLLEKSYQRANRAAGTSLASAGQLYSGSSQNAETYNREHSAQERSSLEGLYRQALQQNMDEGTAAFNQRQDEVNAALWKSIENASRAELEPEESPAGGGGGSGASNPLPAYLQGTPSTGTVKVKNNKTGKTETKKIAVGPGRKAK